MGYKLKVTEHAQSDLDEIIGYIMLELKNPPAAINLLNRIEKVYEALSDTPQIYALCSKKLLAMQGFRKAVIGGYLMIYKVYEEKQTVYVERFFSDMENYENKL